MCLFPGGEPGNRSLGCYPKSSRVPGSELAHQGEGHCSVANEGVWSGSIAADVAYELITALPDELPARCLEALCQIRNVSGSQASFLIRRLAGRHIRYQLLYACDQGTGDESTSRPPQEWPVETFARWESHLQDLRSIYVSDANNADDGSEIEFLRARGYRSVLLLPMVCRSYAVGFVGLATIDHTHVWDESVQDDVRRMAEVLANVLDRADVDTNAASLNRLRRISGRKALEAQEQEWRFLSRELHDEIGPYLTAIKTEATMIDVKAADPAIGKHAGAIKEQADHVYDAVHGLIRRLRSTVLDELGLEGAVRNCIAESPLMKAPVVCDVNIQGEMDDIDDTVASSLLRILQECLNNVARHAGAGVVQVILHRGRGEIGDRRRRYRQGVRTTQPVYLQQDAVSLRVKDDGVGMDLDKHKPGMGLRGIRERVEALGGHLDVTSAPGKGTTIDVLIALSVSSGVGKGG